MTSMDASSGAQRPVTNVQFSGSNGKAGAAPGNFLPSLSVPVAGAASQSFVKDWAKGTETYGIHSFAAEGVNRALAPETPLGSKLRRTPSSKNIEVPPTGDIARSLTYSDIFHLGTQQVPLQEVNAQRFGSTVKSNVGQMTESLKPENRGAFFKDVTAKDYLQKTVVNENINPVKDLIKNNPGQEIGTGLFRTAAVSFMGLDVIKHTSEAYKQAKAQEHGSILGQWRTALETTKAFCKYTVRDGTSWEAAGVGAAIGKAILPIALGGISLGGIAIGALAGVATEKVLDKVMNTGKHDPVNQQANTNPEMKEGAGPEGGSSTGIKK